MCSTCIWNNFVYILNKSSLYIRGETQLKTNICNHNFTLNVNIVNKIDVSKFLVKFEISKNEKVYICKITRYISQFQIYTHVFVIKYAKYIF